MAHSFVNNNLHCVFSTKERQNLIPPEPTGTSSQTDIRRRIYFVLEEERHGIQRTLRVWIESVVPTGLQIILASIPSVGNAGL